MTFKQLLEDLGACTDAREWAGGKTIEQVVSECHRGDWLLWLAQKIYIDKQQLTLAKGLCANTVRHLMKDERSIKAVDTAIAYGNGFATDEELNAAADAAADAYAYAADAADARQKNRMQTADICREVLGQLMIDKVNELLNK